MKVLLSIKPGFAEAIFTGEKGYEFRKKIFNTTKVDKIILYATKPIGKIVGEFMIDDILQSNPKSLWELTHSYAGISRDYFDKYFSGKSYGYAIKIKNPKRYSKTLELHEITDSPTAPQSFSYLP